MVKKVLIAVVVIVAGFAIFVATRPDSYQVERSAAITAPAPVVFAYANDLHKWEAWSPWEKLDPAMKREFGGAAAGVGATYHWVGNDKVGEGKMTITESTPNEKVVIKLEFIKPFESTNTVTFATKKEGESTQVTWAIEGGHNFMTKLMCVFKSMDAMMGPDFEAGLANLKTAAEAEAKKAAEVAAAAAAAAAAAPPPAPAPEPAAPAKSAAKAPAKTAKR